LSPLGALLHDYWALPLAAGVAFLHGWVLWFVLGRHFLATLTLLAGSRLAFGALSALALLGGALGTGPPRDADLLARAAAAALTWIAAWGTDAAVLGAIQRRSRPSWRWNRYDLAALGVAHAIWVGAAAAL